MFAANVWHWWIGVPLLFISVLAVVALVGAYLKTVTAKQHPTRSQKSRQHTDL